MLAKNFPGWKIVVLSDHEGFESFFGAKADGCREITCGALKLYVYQFGGKKPAPAPKPAAPQGGTRNKPKKEWTW